MLVPCFSPTRCFPCMQRAMSSSSCPELLQRPNCNLCWRNGGRHSNASPHDEQITMYVTLAQLLMKRRKTRLHPHKINLPPRCYCRCIFCQIYKEFVYQMMNLTALMIVLLPNSSCEREEKKSIQHHCFFFFIECEFFICLK